MRNTFTLGAPNTCGKFIKMGVVTRHGLILVLLVCFLTFLEGQESSYWQRALRQEERKVLTEGGQATEFMTYSGRRELEEREGLFWYYPEVSGSFNSTFPYGSNDGAPWQGRGLNGRFSAGIEYKSPGLYIAFIPEVWTAQNIGFDVVPGSDETSDYGWGLDRPQRFGEGPHYDVSLGQSGVRLFYRGVTFGLSTENVRIGPGERNNIILSQNAEGFPHIDVGTQRPVQTALGALEARFLWGVLSSSQYVDGGSSNRSFYTGGTLAYSPSWVPGLTVGFNRYFVSPLDTLNGYKAFQFFTDGIFKAYRPSVFKTSTGEDDVDQVLSFSFRWVFQPVGLLLYLEWGRNDHASDLKDFLMQPDHAHAYVAGLKKLFPLKDGSVIMAMVEIADLGNTIGTTVRSTSSWYRHGANPSGYTHKGQLLGAAIGPGSNSQYIGLLYTGKRILWGAGIERIIFDADYFYSFAGEGDYRKYNLQVTLESYMGFLNVEGFDFYLNCAVTHNYNFSWIPSNDLWNISFGVGTRWRVK